MRLRQLGAIRLTIVECVSVSLNSQSGNIELMTLEQKLQIKSEMRGGVHGCPLDVELSFPSLENLRVENLDFVIVFVGSAADIRKLAQPAVKSLREDGMLWLCYPKLTGTINTDISRDRGWEPVNDLGFAGVRQIAIDSTWSALRFRDERFIRRKSS